MNEPAKFADLWMNGEDTSYLRDGNESLIDESS